jgi:two-component system, response regulator RegA
MTPEMLSLTDPTLLLVDDDTAFRTRLALTLERRGFKVTATASLAEARTALAQTATAFAVLDMKLGDGSGLDLVPDLRAKRADMRIIILTGFGNLATAVAAIKTGAVDYLAKPAEPEDIIRALVGADAALTLPAPEPMSADRVRWEHIQRVYELCERNVSETARKLKMHRRTLQRILAKRSPK